MRALLRRRALLKREDIACFSRDVIFDPLGFAVDCFDVFHIAFFLTARGV
jgi:hypothetical protein